jgi:hypothetical protein
VEIAVLVLALAVLVLGITVARQRRPVNRSDAVVRAGELAPVEAASPPANPNSRNQMEIVAVGPSFELRLADKALMQLEPIRADLVPKSEPLSGTYAQWLGALLDNPRVLEFIAGQRWVLAKVPDAIRQGGSWMVSGDTLKAVARAPGSSQFAGIADLVGEGAALGSAAALGPAVIGAVAVAYAHHRIEAAVAKVDERLRHMDRRFRDADMGAIAGGRRLVEEMAEWGPPHLWPQQLRFELAVRRAALDPVCFAQKREVEGLVTAMLKNGEKFVGLDRERRNQLLQETQVLGLASMVKAQLDYTTTMVLLDCEAAPFGLERLELTSQSFVEDMGTLAASLQAAIDGKRPNILAPRTWRRSRATEPAVSHLLAELARVTDAVGSADDTTLVLSVNAAGELEAAVPVDATESEAEAPPE